MNKLFAIFLCVYTLTGHVNAKQPNVVFILAAQLDQFLTDTAAVIPIKNPAYNPSAKPPKAKPAGSRK